MKSLITLIVFSLCMPYLKGKANPRASRAQQEVKVVNHDAREFAAPNSKSAFKQ